MSETVTTTKPCPTTHPGDSRASAPPTCGALDWYRGTVILMSSSPNRLGLLAGLAVIAVALVIGVVTTSIALLLILEWALLVALIGWLVFAVIEKRRPGGRDTQ